jgi:hypothetical protein
MLVLAFSASRKILDKLSPEFFELNCDEHNEFLAYV